MAKIESVIFPDVRPDTGLECKDKSLAQQHMANDCDINQIMTRFEKTGLITHVSNKVAQFGDVSDIADYQSALNYVNAAQESFMALPASIREKFHNDPGRFLAFAEDKRNVDALIEMGLVEVVDRSEKAEPEAEKPKA